MKAKLTVQQSVFLAEKAEKLFQRAARAWERGNNSGVPATLTRCELQCDKLRDQAESLLKPLKIEVDYPGLYPSFKVKGHWHYTPLSAISVALERGSK